MGWSAGNRLRTTSETSLGLPPSRRLLKEVSLCVGRSPGWVAREGFPQLGGDHGKGPFHSLGYVGNLGDCVWGFIQVAVWRAGVCSVTS